MAEESKGDVATAALAVVFSGIGVALLVAFVIMCFKGVQTEERVKDAQKEALERTIKMNNCKLTGYYRRSYERIFLCDDGNTYREDLTNYWLTKVE
jgi:hypothetical protein